MLVIDDMVSMSQERILSAHWRYYLTLHAVVVLFFLSVLVVVTMIVRHLMLDFLLLVIDVMMLDEVLMHLHWVRVMWAS